MRLSISLVYLITLSINAYGGQYSDFEIDGIFYHIVSEEAKTVEVSYNYSQRNSRYRRYDYYGSNLHIIQVPENVVYNDNTYQVIGVSSHAFGTTSASDIQEVHLPNSIEYIGANAFEGTSIVDITIPANVKSIGNNCLKKTNISNVFLLPLMPPTYDGGNIALENTKVYVPNKTNYINDASWTKNLFENILNIDSNTFTYTGKQHEPTISSNITDFTVHMFPFITKVNSGTYNESINIELYKNNTLYETLQIPYQYQISKLPLTIEAPTTQREYGKENPNFNIVFDGFIDGEDNSVLSIQPKIHCDANKESTVGDYDIILSGAEATNYNIEYKKGLLTIIPADQQITWEQDLNDLKVGDQIMLSATTNSGLPVSYIVTDERLASIYTVKNMVYLDCAKEGKTTIRAIQNGDNNHNAAIRVTKNINISTSTAIQHIDTTKKSNNNIYDLYGNIIKKTRPHQIYIDNGKKYVSK